MVAVMGAEPAGVEPVGAPYPVDPIPAADAAPVAETVATDEITWLEANRSQARAAAKGYVHKGRVYVLTFEDPAMADLEVKARSVSLGKFIGLMKLAASLSRFDDGALTLSMEDAEAIEGLFVGLGEALVSWNLLDRATEQPVPATADGLMTVDTDFAMTLVDGWMTAVGGVDAPLGGTSNSGVSSLEGSIPMADPSPSQSS